MNIFNTLVTVLLGAALLLWGRKLFWLFVAAAGFLTGWQIAQAVTQNETAQILIGIFFAIGGALLAMFLKKIAISVAGFLMGGSILLGLAGWFGFDQGVAAWVVYIIGGILGVILIGMFFDWAVILLSSFGGAALIVNAFSMDGLLRVLVIVGLFVLGIVIQSSQMKKNKKD